MGWKIFAIFAAEEAGYFGTKPPHDPARAERLRQQLGLDGYEPAGPSRFDQAMYPRDGALHIGAYPRGMILCDADLPACFFDEQPRRSINGAGMAFGEFKARLLALYPDGLVVALVLHSVVNLWGYSVYSRGELLRSAAGASDDGLIANHGAPLAEEAAILGICPLDEIDAEGYGEDLVFDVSARLFGKRIDAFDEIALDLSAYGKQKTGAASFLKKLFGRA